MNNLFRALNDPTRREILELLKEKDLTAGEIADNFNISKPSISHHLDLLKQANLILSVKKGQFIHYSLNVKTLIKAAEWFLQFKIEKNNELEIQPKPRIRINLTEIQNT
jgi:DNA-binding transcriptional ArsR family regulator